MAQAGTKRAEGEDSEKNLFEDVEISDETAQKLDEIRKDTARAEILLERRNYETLLPIYEKRRQVYKNIPKFWAVAFMHHGLLAIHLQHRNDQTALSYLEDLWVKRDTVEPRAFTLEFHFAENPFFSDKVLTKEYKFKGPAGEKADSDGLTPTMLDLQWERDIQIGTIKINWKDDSHNLIKLAPAAKDDDGDISEWGSFFNYFENETDPVDIGSTIANEIFPEATDYFFGSIGEDIDSDEEDEDEDEDDDDDAEEIDLEKPTKKAKRG